MRCHNSEKNVTALILVSRLWKIFGADVAATRNDVATSRLHFPLPNSYLFSSILFIQAYSIPEAISNSLSLKHRLSSQNFNNDSTN